jgi:hypothetical protein
MTAGDITVKIHGNFRKRSIKNSTWKNPVAIFHTLIIFSLSITACIMLIVHITNISLHRFSSALFITMATGFFHVLFLILRFLKLPWILTVISPAVIDIYTIPTSGFIVIVVLVLAIVINKALEKRCNDIFVI